jgi:hypothetical protein
MMLLRMGLILGLHTTQTWLTWALQSCVLKGSLLLTYMASAAVLIIGCSSVQELLLVVTSP